MCLAINRAHSAGVALTMPARPRCILMGKLSSPLQRVKERFP